MDLSLALILGFVTALAGWIVWDLIAPLIGGDDDK